MELEELFRSKLENAEVIPGDGVGANLMRKAGRKEFIRFNPSRFNVWYLGGIVAAAVTAGVIIGTGREEGKRQEIIPVPPEKEVSFLTIPAAKPYIRSEKADRITGAESKAKSEKSSVTAEPNGDSGKLSQNSAGKNKTDNVVAGRAETPEKTGVIMKKLTRGNISDFQLQKKTMASFDINITAGCMPGYSVTVDLHLKVIRHGCLMLQENTRSA